MVTCKVMLERSMIEYAQARDLSVRVVKLILLHEKSFAALDSGAGIERLLEQSSRYSGVRNICPMVPRFFHSRISIRWFQDSFTHVWQDPYPRVLSFEMCIRCQRIIQEKLTP
ncbi:hypothetical protein R1flu_023449 [Riccia fluitans]|uniref:Uncharacterized protein n=1 Tax=Riccia fluitans TaxID=41844 RepID=A0ABD1XS75_9MARC